MSDELDLLTQQEQAWNDIYETFKVNETPNGPGSFMENTKNIRAALPYLLLRYDIQTLLDAPCGDVNWFSRAEWHMHHPRHYLGWDVQPEIIAGNKLARSESDVRGISFEVQNILTVPNFPAVDAILVRDFMIHLPMYEVSILLDKIRASKIHYLIATSFPKADNTFDIPASGHDDRPGYWYNEVNLEAPPFNLLNKIESITEDDGEHELAVFDLWAF